MQVSLRRLGMRGCLLLGEKDEEGLGWDELGWAGFLLLDWGGMQEAAWLGSGCGNLELGT
jgi:hypothetical protein